VLLAISGSLASAGTRARSRTIYLVHDGAEIHPGTDDSAAGTSSLVTHAVTIPPWTTTQETWNDTVACVSEIYSRFAVTITDVDPGDVPHIKAIFGGTPSLLGLSRSTAGMSPFAEDCSVIESSIVFTFTDILAPDGHSACEDMAHEIAHSYGLDHELLASDTMTFSQDVLDREFEDVDASCGEDSPRPCGLNGSTCRATQNSYALLADRVGLAGEPDPAPDPESVGCASTGGSGPGTLVLTCAVLLRSRARRRRA